MVNNRIKKTNITETLFFGMLLAFSGGLMDAYSFLFRGGVFANAQTGNILLLGVNLARGEFAEALKYALPVAAFSVGIAISFLLRHRFKESSLRHMTALCAELILFVAVAFIPQSSNNIANALISLACGIQLEAFGVIHANNVATTMCIGNLRSAIDNALDFCVNKEKPALKKAGIYAAVIAAFVLGAVAGSALIDAVGAYAILGSAVIVALCGGISLSTAARRGNE